MIDSKKIVNNTIFLYIRMILVMVVSFYSVRVVLDVLGAEDFGIYSVVAGIVLLMAFLTDPLSLAVQRYYSYYLGKGEIGKLNIVFNTSIIIFVLISISILIIGLLIGVWFVNTSLTIPEERLETTNTVFIISIISFIATILSIPFQGLIISKEKMSLFAYISILETILKLLVVFLLQYFNYDKLLLYTILILFSNISITFLYILVCLKLFKEIHFKLVFDKQSFKEIFSFIGWNVVGGFSYVVNNQGINILFNTSFGPLMNASRGVSVQINGAINQLAQNITKSINPQIVKAYSIGDYSSMNLLVLKGTKITFYLVAIISFPIILFTDDILKIWLVNIPDKSVIFVQLILVNLLVESLSNLLKTSITATGDIRSYQLIIGGFMILNLPITYLYLYFGAQPESAFYILICTSILSLILRLYLLKKRVNLSIIEYFKVVLLPIIKVLITFSALLVFVNNYVFQLGFVDNFIMRASLITLLFSSLVYLIGLNLKEKEYLKNILLKISKKNIKK